MIEFGSEPFGHPWHGVCTRAGIGLPNGQTMVYPGFRPEGGDVHLFKIPGAPGGTTTPEDVAAGRQWLDYALISGSTMHLYGKALGEGKWLYLDPDGVRWLVSTTLQTNSVANVEGQSITVTLDRFGEFLVPAERHEYTVAVPNLGQDTPAVDNARYDGATLQKNEILAHLFSVHPQGEQAVFLLYAHTDIYTQRMQWGKRPVGWLMLSITGPGASAVISLAVLKNRSETIGTMTFSGGFETVYLYRVTEITDTYVDYQGEPTLVETVSTTTSFTSASSGLTGYDPSGPGSTTTAYALHQVTELPVGMASGTRGAVVESIIAINYRPDGTLTYTTARYTDTQTRIDNQVLVVDSELNAAWTVEGVQTSDVPYVWHTTMSVSNTHKLVIDILVDGAVVQSHDAGDCVTAYGGSWQYGSYDSYGLTGTTSHDGYSSAKLFEASAPVEGQWPAEALRMIQRFIEVDYVPNNGTRSHVIGVCGYSNSVHGVNTTVTWSADNGYSMSQHFIGNLEVSGYAYASRHPVTGEVVAGTAKVCWV